jgi:hypothetical protein
MMIYDHPVGAALDEYHREPRRVHHRLAVAHEGELPKAGADHRNVAENPHAPLADLDLAAAGLHFGVGVILADGGGPFVDGRVHAAEQNGLRRIELHQRVYVVVLNAAAQRSISALASSAGPATTAAGANASTSTRTRVNRPISPARRLRAYHAHAP